MRKGIPASIQPNLGDRRYVTAFLWLPMTLVNPNTQQREMRWMETATWAEEYRCTFLPKQGLRGEWVPQNWSGR